MNPGYPNTENTAKKCGDNREYQENLGKFLDRNSVQFALQEHDQECKRYVVQKWGEKHPEVPSHKVATYVDKKQESQYVQDNNHDNFGVSKKESSWLEKFWSKETVDPSQFPNNIDRLHVRRRNNSDSGAGSEISLPTPSAHYPPTKTPLNLSLLKHHHLHKLHHLQVHLKNQKLILFWENKLVKCLISQMLTVVTNLFLYKNLYLML